MPKVWNKRDPNTPKDAVYVGRPSKWGNPFVIGKDGTRSEVIERYRAWIETRSDLHVSDLCGKDLVCWCVPAGGVGLGAEPRLCHGQILLAIANGDE